MTLTLATSLSELPEYRRVLLTLVYYLVVTPYGVVTRLVGRDPLRRRGARAESYWVERKTTRQAREQFERLF